MSEFELIFGTDELFSRDDFINNDPWALGTMEGITISDKNFLCGHAVDTPEGKRIVSAIFDSYDNGNQEYSFDTVVDHRYQRQGLGKELIDIAMGRFKNEILDADPDAKLNLDVINENIIPYLERTV